MRTAAMFAIPVPLIAGTLAAWQPAEPEAAAEPRWIQPTPGLRVDPAARVVEFEGRVAIDCHDPETPHVYLELVVCAPDTREHESLVVTDVAPSALHAALLVIGLEPGHPALFDRGNRPIPAAGDAVIVELVTADGRASPVREWIESVRTGENLPRWEWVFAGSRLAVREGREWYDAEGTGVVVGLAAFGSEVIGPVKAFSPEASVEEPVWIADADRVPRRFEPVTVRVRAAGDP